MRRMVILGAALFGAWGCGDSEAGPEVAMNGALGGSGSDPNDAESATLTDVVTVSAGYLHSCALRGDGSVVCWGDNTDGGLGNGAAMTPGTVNQSRVPVQVSGIGDAATISAGQGYSCAVLNSGRVQCWGANDVGQLGNGTRTSSSVPVDVAGIDDAVDVTTGGYHACALHGSGSVSCWGQTSAGLGDGMTTDSLVPISVTGLSAVNALASGGITGGHTCAVTFDQKVYCWGTNFRGQLGDGPAFGSDSDHATPQEVSGLPSASSVDAGDSMTCAVMIGGALFCWGSGSLGDGADSANALPVEVTGIGPVGEVSVGSSQICVRLQIGTVECWGYNGIESTALPEPIVGIDSALTISTGGSHSCARITTGTVQCWGHNQSGVLGDGTENESSVPVTVTGVR